jgi:hypothetical protein
MLLDINTAKQVVSLTGHIQDSGDRLAVQSKIASILLDQTSRSLARIYKNRVDFTSWRKQLDPSNLGHQAAAIAWDMIN